MTRRPPRLDNRGPLCARQSARNRPSFVERRGARRDLCITRFARETPSRAAARPIGSGSRRLDRFKESDNPPATTSEGVLNETIYSAMSFDGELFLKILPP